MAAPRAPLTLDTLPQDVLAAILANSPDLDSLLCTIISCRAFYRAFYNAEPSTIRSLLLREIGTALLPEALRLFQIASPPNTCQTDLDLRIDASQAPFDVSAPQWKNSFRLANAVGVLRLYSIIETLAKRFASFYLGRLEKSSKREHEDPPSTPELVRIQRALYRFELYCQRFPPPDEDPDEQFRSAQKRYFSSMPLWELEQLACIYESLWREVTPIFNSLVLHNRSWRKYSITYVDEFDDLYIENILSKGLHTIRKIIQAKSSNERAELLGNQIPVAASEFVPEAIANYNYYLLKSGGVASDKPHNAPVDKATEEENDSPSPKYVWDWSHDLKLRAGLVMEMEYKPLRACGYVFWDVERLKGTGLLEQDWLDIECEADEEGTAIAPDLGSSKPNR